ncbi:MAG: hypothetical protein R2797_03140 [Gelidibacter sp.]
MKLSETVTTVLITLLGIMPFIWFTYIGKKSSIKSKKTIKDLIKGENLKFAEKEFWNHNFIGIDKEKQVLLFVKIKSPENEIVRVDLNNVKSCVIHKNTRDIKREKKLESELQQMNLELQFYSKPSVTLNLYDIEDRLSEDFEMKRAEKWKQLITDNIQKSSVVAA